MEVVSVSIFGYYVLGIGALGQCSLLKENILQAGSYFVDVAIIPVGYGDLYSPASLLRSGQASFTVNEVQQAATGAVRQSQELLPVFHVKAFIHVNCRTKLGFDELHVDSFDILQLL